MESEEISFSKITEKIINKIQNQLIYTLCPSI